MGKNNPESNTHGEVYGMHHNALDDQTYAAQNYESLKIKTSSLELL